MTPDRKSQSEIFGELVGKPDDLCDPLAGFRERLLESLQQAESSCPFFEEMERQRRNLLEDFKRIREADSEETAKTLARIPRMDFSPWLPPNLKDISDLSALPALTHDEGLPLTWVPRAEIVEALILAADRNARLEILAGRVSDILDDCDSALAEVNPNWSQLCRDAIRALRSDLPGPAQSHASNVIDSLLRLLWPVSRASVEAKKRADANLDEFEVGEGMKYLTLRPLNKALQTWWANCTEPFPTNFNRNVTSHHAGYLGAFKTEFALLAVMLATSLAAQFATRKLIISYELEDRSYLDEAEPLGE